MRLKATLLASALVAGSFVLATPAAAGRTVTISGGGWGHGIGMSQYGAYGRAEKGKSASQIVEHYYSGARVTTTGMPGIRVGLLPNYGSSVSSISFGTTPGAGSGKIVVKVAGRAKRIAAGNSGDSWKVNASTTGALRIYKNGKRVKVDGASLFGGSDTPLVLRFEKFGSLLDVGGKSYDYAHGKAEIGSYASASCANEQCVRLTLALPMQKYLYGLAEVPSSWPAAVLQAQAMAGRTYAYSKISRSGQNRYPCACAVYDSTIDQAYAGDGKRTGSGIYWADWKAAVDDTKDQVINHSGEPIQALYSSSSGGHTENNENVWGGAPIPYLRGVPDGPDYAGGANPNFTWKVQMSWWKLRTKLNAAYGTGKLKRFEIVGPLGVSGRVTTVDRNNDTGGMRIVGSNKTVRLSGWETRQALGLKDSLFTVKVETSGTT
jgi:SpoIID/LytB domain protein